jgi:hypothetical protein
MATTGQDLVNDCRAEVIEPNPAFFSTTRMLGLVNLAQQEYVRKTRCLQNFAFTSTQIGVQVYQLPPDWLGSELVLWQDQTNVLSPLWRRLKPTTLEKMAQESPNFLSDNPNMWTKPMKYWIVGKSLYIYPKPQYAGSNDLFIYYQSREIPLTDLSQPLSIDDSLVPGLRAYILWKMWKQDQEDALAEEQHNLFKEEIGWGIKWRNQRTLDLKRKIDIDSYMPFSIGGNNYSANGSINPLDLS